MIRAALETPLGEMIAIADEKALHLLEFSNRKNLARQIARLPQDIKRGTNPIIKALSHELALYFEGRLKNFKTPLVLHGSVFQKEVWSGLQSLSYGETLSYKALAERIGKAKSIRPLASAVGANAHALIIPCHRVIGSDGSLTGYAGGLERKKALLNIEGALY